ncbi:MAG: c-type cytochrome, partial [Phycisphaeraceae bacterium]|nr:c-type cytochrome [Phycisphaeraceae bacterium]
ATTVIGGLVVIGLRGVEWARWGGPRMFNVPTAPTTSALTSKSVPVRTAPATDPEAGAAAFARTCASCHGSKGQGVAGVAPALKPSDFVHQSSVSQLTALITLGRQPNDPASKTGRMMPARGGNPFLSDADIANIVDFLRLESDADKTVAGDAQEPPAAADVPHWVVPPPPAGPAGLSPAFAPHPPVEPMPTEVRLLQPSVSERAMAPMAAALSGTHGMLVLIGIGLMAAVMGHAYLDPSEARAQVLARFSRLYWLGLVLTWGMIFPLLYLV